MIFIAITLGLLPGFVWLFLYLKEDLHPEPKRLIILTFLAGMISALVALVAETFLNKHILSALGISTFDITSDITSLNAISSIEDLVKFGFGIAWLVAISLIEELVKFAAAYLVVKGNPYFDEPVDAMVYMVIAGLGFATLENIGAASGAASVGGAAAAIHSVFVITSLRFVGATLLHSLASAVVGYFWALDIRDFKTHKYLYVGLGMAILLHTVFNYLILQYENLTYIVIFLAIVGFFVLNDFEKLKRKIV